MNEPIAPLENPPSPGPALARIRSIDALRGLVMFTMIFVNDLAGAPDRIVPPGMKHFHGRNGMTFVDLVFPAFLFIVGMSIPFGLGSKLRKEQPLGRVIGSILARTFSLLAIGILMVNEVPDSAKMGWSGTLWSCLFYVGAIALFCRFQPTPLPDPVTNQTRMFRTTEVVVRLGGGTLLFCLALVFRGHDNHRIIQLVPFSIHTEWFGILGLIGWAYLVGSVTYLLFRENRTALLGCVVLLMCLYPADRNRAFEGFWLSRYVGIGEMLGSQAAITVAGLLLASMLTGSDLNSWAKRTRFSFLFIAGCAAGALLLHRLYGINKNNATPSWSLWSCAITAAFWLCFHFLMDREPSTHPLLKWLAIAGRNVLLAYLLSEMLPSLIDLLHLGNGYQQLAAASLPAAIARSAGCAVLVLGAATGLNRLGFRLAL